MAAYTSFLCTSCRTEIQASPDMVGLETECPACGAKICIPAPDSDGVIRHAADDEDPETIEAMKSRTIRIELGDGDL
ncbi:MAG: hypothetical protein IJH50_08385 [Kiritimatiellae bacterium]|nr:hypothetical protein [Kiritimatiellia bacterium]